jgi:hypothetical protein
VNGSVKDIFNDEAPYFWLFEREEMTSPFEHELAPFFYGFSYTKKRPDCVLLASADYSEAVVYVPEVYAEKLVEFALSNAMMLLYTFRTSGSDTLMIHASVTSFEGKGYVFLGKSGTGKSTHSSLWLKHIEGTELLNDDNPVLRIVDGKVRVYGSPWSGKTACYKNEHYPVAGFCRLSQAPHNHIKRLQPLMAIGALLPSCPPIFAHDEHLQDLICSTIGEIVGSVGVYHLECLPNTEAAEVCYQGLQQRAAGY